MKRLSLLFCMFIIANTCFSQTSENEAQIHHYKNEIGLDLGAFLTKKNNALSTSSPEDYQPIYFFNYKALGKTVNGRFAIGGNWLSSTLVDEPQGTINSLFLKVGFESFKNLSERWEFFGGADLNTDFYTTSVPLPSSSNKIKEKIQIVGWGPLLGFRYKVHERVNFQFESAFRVNHSWEYTKFTSSSSYSPSNTMDEGPDKLKSTFTTMPFRLLVNVRF